MNVVKMNVVGCCRIVGETPNGSWLIMESLHTIARSSSSQSQTLTADGGGDDSQMVSAPSEASSGTSTVKALRVWHNKRLAAKSKLVWCFLRHEVSLEVTIRNFLFNYIIYKPYQLLTKILLYRYFRVCVSVHMYFCMCKLYVQYMYYALCMSIFYVIIQ